MTETLRLATRGSQLALRQTAAVRDALASPRRDVELVEVTTRGDEVRDELIHRLGKTGAFVRALDETVLDGETDAAVHSLKDVPTEDVDDLVIAGLPERAPAGDVLVTPDGKRLADLPRGATVGTSSLRRKAQLLAARPDLTVEPLRGNVDTRVEKLLAPTLQDEHERRVEAEADERGDVENEENGGDDENGDAEGSAGGEDGDGFEMSVEEWFDSLSELEREAMGRELETGYDAIVLAEAGLRRSGLYEEVGTTRLDRSEFVPAPGQGAIAVTAADQETAEVIRSAIDHERTRVETTVERTILAELGGGCVVPMGVYGLLQGAHVKTTVRVQSADGTEEIRETRDLPVQSHVREARELARELADRGATDLIDRARAETES